MENKNKILKILILTIDEPYFIPKTCYPLIVSKDIDVIGFGIMAPIVGKKSIFKFALDFFNSFGIKGTIQHVAFYAKCYLVNIFGVISKKNPTLSLSRICKKKNIPIIRIKDINNKEEILRIRKLNPDIIISIAATQIFKKNIIKSSKIATLNVHAGLLPNYRGASPSFWNLLNDEVETGVTVHLIDERIDSGDIVMQEKIKIEKNETLFSLNSKVAQITPNLLIKSFKYVINKDFISKPIDISNGSYFSLPKRIDVKNFLQKGNFFF